MDEDLPDSYRCILIVFHSLHSNRRDVFLPLPLQPALGFFPLLSCWWRVPQLRHPIPRALTRQMQYSQHTKKHCSCLPHIILSTNGMYKIIFIYGITEPVQVSHFLKSLILFSSTSKRFVTSNSATGRTKLVPWLMWRLGAELMNPILCSDLCWWFQDQSSLV